MIVVGSVVAMSGASASVAASSSMHHRRHLFATKTDHNAVRMVRIKACCTHLHSSGLHRLSCGHNWVRMSSFIVADVKTDAC